MPSALLWHQLLGRALSARSIQGGSRGITFPPELSTFNFPSGTPNDPIIHEEIYFFGKLVSISSLHTSWHSIFPTCQLKYAVVYPHLLLLSRTSVGRQGAPHGRECPGLSQAGTIWWPHGALFPQPTLFLFPCLVFSNLCVSSEIPAEPLCVKLTHVWCFIQWDYKRAGRNLILPYLLFMSARVMAMESD